MSKKTQNKTIRELQKLEGKVSKSSIISKKSNRPNKGLILTVVIILLMVLTTVSLFMYRNYSEDQKDKERFILLKDTMSNALEEFSSQQDSLDARCSYSSGTGLQKGGWVCVASIEFITDGHIVKKNFDNIRSVLVKYNFNFDNSSEIKERGEIDRYQVSVIPEQISNIYCDLVVELNKGKLSCSGGAQKSWYPNSEVMEALPGKNAWKE